MSDLIPREVLGLAIFVHVLSFVAVFLGVLLCFMLWRHGEGLSYILLLGVSTTLGATQGLATQLDYTINWQEIQAERFDAARDPRHDQTSKFGKADSGWRTVLAAIGIYLYNVDSLLILFWAITLFIGTWNIRIKSNAKKIMAIVMKTTAFVLPAIMVSVYRIKALRKYPVVFLAVINFIMAVSMILGTFLVLAILYKYLLARSVFKRFFSRQASSNGFSCSSGIISSRSTVTRSGGRSSTTDKWLIIRFTLIMTVLITFESAIIVYQIVNFKRNRKHRRRDTMPPDREFSIEQTRVDLFQYIPGVVPSIITWSIFGTTATFRREYMMFLRKWCCWLYLSARHPSRAWRKRSHSRQDSPDVESPSRQTSFAKEGVASISSEVNTAISLSSMSSLKPPPPMSNHRFGRDVPPLLIEQPSVFRSPPIIPTRGSPAPTTPNARPLHSRALSDGTPLRTSCPSPSKAAVKQHSRTQSTRAAAAVDKALPALPPQACLAPSTMRRTPAVGVGATHLNRPDVSWLSINAESNCNSVHSNSGYAPNQSTTGRVLSPSHQVRSHVRRGSP